MSGTVSWVTSATDQESEVIAPGSHQGSMEQSGNGREAVAFSDTDVYLWWVAGVQWTLC